MFLTDRQIDVMLEFISFVVAAVYEVILGIVVKLSQVPVILIDFKI